VRLSFLIELPQVASPLPYQSRVIAQRGFHIGLASACDIAKR
jgi:hypothetical protein